MNEIDVITEKLLNVGSAETIKKMERIGISPQRAVGVNLTQLREIAKPYKGQHELALQLWDCKYHEAKIIATMIDDPKQVTRVQISKWASEFYSWDICDLTCRNLFERTPYVQPLIARWTKCNRVFLKRAGFVLIARQAKVNKKMGDKKFIHYLSLIEKNSDDERNFVKKALSWSLRQIGKRNDFLRLQSNDVANRLLQKGDKSSLWIARSYLQELGGDND